MGNNIAKKYDVPKEHTATAGHLGMWKIWPGKSKDSGNLCSIWVFDRNELAKTKKPATALTTTLNGDKTTTEMLYQIMKKDLQVIKESQACQHLISSLEVIEESKNGLVFTTERIVCSLADILNNFENVPSGHTLHSDFFDESGTVSELEVSRAFLSLAEGLQFLHNVQRRLHLGISPESVVITANGKWKLCGFGFSLSFQQGDQQRIASPYFLKAGGHQSAAGTTGSVRVEPDLQYQPPETTDGGYNPPGVRYLTPQTDSFALAMLMYDVYRYNIGCSQRDRHLFQASLCISNNDVNQHLIVFENLQRLDFSFLLPGIDRLIMGLLQLNLQFRMTISDIVSSTYFVTGNQQIITTLETLHTRDVGTQSSQLLTLIHQLDTFPLRILKFTALPCIGKLCLQNPLLWEYALPLHKLLARLLGREQYKPLAAPYIAAGLTANSSTECTHAFLSSLDFIQESFDQTFFAINATCLFVYALEKANPLLQNTAFERLCHVQMISALEGANLTDKLVPQLCKDACRNPDINVKIQALYAVSLVVRKLDKQYVVDNILPSLKYITDHDRSSTVSLHVVGCYEAISDSVGPEYIASSVLPAILPYLADKSFDRRSFETIVRLAKTLLRKITDVRCQELNVTPVSFGEDATTGPHSSAMDPFSGAKAILQNTRNTYKGQDTGGLTRLTTAPPPPPTSAPPPLPTGPPPPPPSAPPPPLPGMTFGSSTSAGPSNGISAYNSSFGSTNNPPVPPPSVPPPLPTSAPPPVTAPLGKPLEILSAPPLETSSSPMKGATKEKDPKASGGSWFSFSSSKSANKKEDKPSTDDYQPPVVSTATTTSAAGPTSSNSIDLDDFLSSFSSQSKTAPAANTPFVSPPAVPSIPPPASSAPAPSVSSFAPPSQSQQQQRNLEQQLRETQEQIARLSSGLTPAVPAAISAAPPSSIGTYRSTTAAPVVAPGPGSLLPSTDNSSGPINGFSYGSTPSGGAAFNTSQQTSSGRIGNMPSNSAAASISTGYVPPSAAISVAPVTAGGSSTGYRPSAAPGIGSVAPQQSYGGMASGLSMQQQQPSQSGFYSSPQHGGMNLPVQSGNIGGGVYYPPQQQVGAFPTQQQQMAPGMMGYGQQQQFTPPQYGMYQGGSMPSQQQQMYQMQQQQMSQQQMAQQQQRLQPPRGPTAPSSNSVGSAFDFLN